MRTNPFSDALAFLFQGGWLSVVFLLLIISSVAVAVVNLAADKEQRTASHAWNYLARFFIGALWWQQSLWKIPPLLTHQPDSNAGLRYWMGQMVDGASSELQRSFVKNVLQPHFDFFAPQVYFSEVFIGASLILGIFSRLGALLGAAMALNLWLGLYRSPDEWPWTYFFLLVIQVMLFMYPPGRSLGIDAILKRRQQKSTGAGILVRVVNLLS